MEFGTAGEEFSERGTGAQFREETGGALVVVKGNGVVLELFEGALTVPDEEKQTPIIISTTPRIPVGGAIPIGVGAVKVHEHEIAEGGQIEQLRDLRVTVGFAEAGIRHREQFLPGNIIAF